MVIKNVDEAIDIINIYVQQEDCDLSDNSMEYIADKEAMLDYNNLIEWIKDENNRRYVDKYANIFYSGCGEDNGNLLINLISGGVYLYSFEILCNARDKMVGGLNGV